MMDDLVSRKWLLEEYDRRHKGPRGGAYQMILDAPSVGRPTGRWIDFSMSIKGVPTEACGECGEWSYGMGKNYCPNCGSPMEVEHEAN